MPSDDAKVKETKQKTEEVKAEEAKDHEAKVEEMKAAAPKKSNKPDGIETAADKRARSEKVALRLQQEAHEAHVARMKKLLDDREAAQASIPGMLSDIDAKINKVIEVGARNVAYTVPVAKDEHPDIVAYKTEMLIAELVDLGYNVMNMSAPSEPAPPVAAGDEPDEEDKPADDEVAEVAPVLVISW